MITRTHSSAYLNRLVVVLCASLSGCAAVTNPLAGGVPVDRMPLELLGQSRQGLQPIDHALLGQPPAKEYRLAPGDVLGVWIEGVLGDRRRPIQVIPGLQEAVPGLNQVPRAPGAGLPIRVEDDGQVLLPQLPPVHVAGLSVTEAREAIRAAYVGLKILQPGREQILVTLLYPRLCPVVVLREELTGRTEGPEGFESTSKRGTGHEVFLPPDQNDVLHALELTGGLPAPDACDEVIVYRAMPHAGNVERNEYRSLPPLPNGMNSVLLENGMNSVLRFKGPPAVRLPLRWPADKPLPFGPQDVVLCSGDVVFVKARNNDVYYTAGLLPPGEYVLPRDVDLDVVEAISRVQGPLLSGATAVSKLSGELIRPGIGNPNLTLLSVLRKTPDGGQVTIEVDIDRAVRDPRERILVQPGDILVLQEKPQDALARYFGQTFVNFNLLWDAIHSRFVAGVIDISAPDRLPGRLGQVVFPRQAAPVAPVINQNTSGVSAVPF